MNAINHKQKQHEVELASLLAGVTVVDPIWDRKITGIAVDSRKVKAGDLFIACEGGQYDARQFINDAIKQGAAAIVASAEQASPEEDITGVPVFFAADLKQKVGVIASRFYNHPSRRMHIIGITGTNGKTSCSHFLAAALHTPQQPSGIIGTVGYGAFGAVQQGELTTPDAVEVQVLLADFERQGIKTVTMEASSHALDQDRVKQVEMQTAIFTNLSRDHLDYHGTIEAYGRAKQKLFEKFGLRQAIINLDDDFSQTLLKAIPKTVQVFTYSLSNAQASVSACNIELRATGIKATVNTPWGQGVLETSLLGRFNLSNLLAVLTTLGTMGIPLNDALLRIKKINGVAGRMQAFSPEGSPTVVIDYAHTPDALQHALQALKEHTTGKLWCVFGCGGDRDQGKRPLMGKAAEQYADHIILTDDNPRHEEPQAIINDIQAGFTNKNSVTIEHDRRRALTHALEQAKAGDCILLAGKGHEAYQQIGDKRIPLSDQAIVEEALHCSADV